MQICGQTAAFLNFTKKHLHMVYYCVCLYAYITSGYRSIEFILYLCMPVVCNLYMSTVFVCCIKCNLIKCCGFMGGVISLSVFN